MLSNLARFTTHLVILLALLVGLGLSLQAIYKLFIEPDPTEFVRSWFQIAWSVPLALLATSSLLFRKPLRTNTAILLLSLLVAVYLFEIALWALNIDLSDRRGMHFSQLQKQGITVDTRTPLHVVFDLHRTGVRAVPIFSPSENLQMGASRRRFPLSAISRKLTIHCNESGNYATYASDEYGFNNPAGLWRYSPPFDIAIFGDSFAAGACVGRDEDFAAHVRRKFPATANLGMGGTGPLIQLATMREYLPFLKPRVVLWLYYENDLDELQREIRDPMLRNYLEPGFTQRLINRQREIDRAYLERVERELKDFQPIPPQTNSEITRTFRLFRARRLVFSSLLRAPVHDKSLLDSYAQIVLAAGQQVDALGGELFLVYLPDWVRVKSRPTDLSYRQKEDVLAAAKRAGIPVIDIGDIFRSHPDAAHSFFAYAGSHYNKEGYRVAADYVLDRLPEFTQSGSRSSR